mmetsp:Transcript_34473/g.75385  ORF Transcript_34473/g.75385 Transcript_34473/m.75385 type:complete len:208 (+) Transcript_34473:325-948(+)
MSTVDLTVARLGVRYDQTNHVDFISLLLQLLEHFLHLGLLHACIWDEQILALAQRRCQDFFLQFLSRSSQKLHKILVPDMRIGHSLLISSMCQSEHVAIDLDKVFRAIRLARLGEQHLESFLAESGLAGPRGPQYEHRLGFLAFLASFFSSSVKGLARAPLRESGACGTKILPGTQMPLAKSHARFPEGWLTASWQDFIPESCCRTA